MTQPLIDIVVTKTDSPDPVQVGATLTYTITVSNRGPSTATNVQLTDPLPSSLTVISVTPSQGTCTTSPVLSCSLGTLAPGALVTIVVAVRPTVTGVLENTATAVGTEPEANPQDNSATAITTVVGVTTPPTQPKPPSKPKPPKSPKAVCIEYRVAPFAVRVAARSTLRVAVTADGKPVGGVRVLVRGAGAYDVARSNKGGIALLQVRAKRTGFLTVTLPGRKTCRSARKVGVVAPRLTPPVTG